MEYKAYDEDSLHLDPGSPFFLDHVSRYWWASAQARGKTALDCACGKGYGSFILSRNAKSVTGVDLNVQSLELARKTFAAPNLKYEQCDVFSLPSLGQKFDLITAFEVIEHIPPETTQTFLQGLSSVLKPGGVLMISTPNHEVVLKSGSSVPEFHINNFPSAVLRRELEKNFRFVEMLGQFRKRQGLSQLVFDLDYFNLRHQWGGLFRKKALSGTTSIDQAPARQEPGRTLFETPYPGVENYLFSPRHWRQAGLTVAVCRNA